MLFTQTALRRLDKHGLAPYLRPVVGSQAWEKQCAQPCSGTFRLDQSPSRSRELARGSTARVPIGNLKHAAAMDEESTRSPAGLRIVAAPNLAACNGMIIVGKTWSHFCRFLVSCQAGHGQLGTWPSVPAPSHVIWLRWGDGGMYKAIVCTGVAAMSPFSTSSTAIYPFSLSPASFLSFDRFDFFLFLFNIL